MLHRLLFGVFSAVAVTVSTATFAQGTAGEAKAMLEKAVAAVKADKTKALDTFNKGEGGFLDRDLYVFCSNVSDGKLLADGNPNAKQLIGTDDRTLKDSTGNPFGQELFTAGQKSSQSPSQGKRNVYQRSQDVRVYVLARAQGKCEGYNASAPFLRPDGNPYLELHHLRRLSDGGPDHPAYVIALCPNCHRRVHAAADGPAYNAKLSASMASIET
jgi:hypothetical protein